MNPSHQLFLLLSVLWLCSCTASRDGAIKLERGENLHYTYQQEWRDGTIVTITRKHRKVYCTPEIPTTTCRSVRSERIIYEYPTGETEVAFRKWRQPLGRQPREMAVKTLPEVIDTLGYFTRRSHWWNWKQTIRFYSPQHELVLKERCPKHYGALALKSVVYRGHKELIAHDLSKYGWHEDR